MISIEKIAQLAGCSISTVSKALNGYTDVSPRTRQRILDIATKHGYVPNAMAQSLARKRSNLIGIVYDVEYGLKNAFFVRILESFRRYVELNGYDLLLLSHQAEEGPNYLRHCRSRRIDAVLVVSESTYQNAVKELRDSELAVVTFDPFAMVPNSIMSDNYESVKKACRYLYELGHRKIAFIQGDNNTLIGQSRDRGYKDFIKEYGLQPMEVESINNISYTYADGYRTMQAIFERFGQPEAVCAASDLMAIGAMGYLKANGISIPDDVSIMGFDDLDVCEIVTPNLTTIHQDYEKIGQLAFEALMRLVDEPKQLFDPIIVPTYIVVRGSCKKRNLAK
jgi:LacI family transcriptional regulator